MFPKDLGMSPKDLVPSRKTWYLPERPSWYVPEIPGMFQKTWSVPEKNWYTPERPGTFPKYLAGMFPKDLVCFRNNWHYLENPGLFSKTVSYVRKRCHVHSYCVRTIWHVLENLCLIVFEKHWLMLENHGGENPDQALLYNIGMYEYPAVLCLKSLA